MLHCSQRFILALLLYYKAIPMTLSQTTDSPDEDFEEGECVPSKAITNLDYKWLLDTEKQWYIIMANKDYMHRSLVGSYWQSIDRLTLDQIKRSCLHHNAFDPSQKLVEALAFGRSGYYKILGLEQDGSFTYQELKDDEPVGPIAHANITSTDNNLFLTYVVCYEDGQRGFVATSHQKSPPEDVLQQLEEYALGLGFNPNYLLRLKFDNCLMLDEFNNEIIPTSTNTSTTETSMSQSEPNRTVRQSYRRQRQPQQLRRSYRQRQGRHYNYNEQK